MRIATIESPAKGVMIAAGAAVFIYAGLSVPLATLTPGFLLLLAFATLLAPRMSLTLPGSRFALSFSDASVFLAFLLYGGPSAILLAGVESLANCLYLRSSGFKFGRWMVASNVAINVTSIGCVYALWLNVPAASGLLPMPGTTQHLIATLSCLALAQFLFSSVLAAFLFRINGGGSIVSTWLRSCYSSSMTQLVGAGVAGLVFKIIGFGDPLVALIGFIAMGVAYFSYKQTLNEVKGAILQAETAERLKSEVERDLRLEAEQHAEELRKALDRQEMANEALRRSESDLVHSALFDPLTRLPNRRHFAEILSALIGEYKADPERTFHVLFLDIRKFKHINDSLGHSFGDRVLDTIARRVVQMLNETDTVARIGGDEFAIILKGLSSVGKAQKVARKIYDSLSKSFSLSGNRLSLDLNIGVAPCDAEYETPQEVLRDADIAMHHAKEKSSGVAVFSKELRVRFLERVRLENDLRHAVDRGELSMSYQPIIDLENGKLFGMEALLRWNHTDLGQIPPNKFIPIAEESGIIIPLTSWILEETCKQLTKWHQSSSEYSKLIMSVNISGRHLANDDLVDDVENALIEAKLDACFLKLEITESAAMQTAEHTIDVLNRLKKLGVQLSIDDFGTGYSSLSYLHRLPFDTLKVDRSFVSAVRPNGEGSEILQTIISLAKSLKKKIIAEGIETEAQLELLEDLGCEYGQGYLMSKPLTVEKMDKALAEHRTWLRDKILNESHITTSSDDLPIF